VSGYTNGLPTTLTDALGYQSSVGYDASGNVTSAQDANYNTASATFNALGWKMTGTDGLNHTTTYTYDNWGRVTAVTAPDNTRTTTTYDLDGNVLTVTDADNHTVTNVYDADDRLLTTTNGRGDVVTYTYDGPSGLGSPDRNGQTQRGLLSSKTDGNGHTTFYSYTARNEPSATYYPDGTQESVTYDENGNTLSRTKPDGKVIAYAYDPDNRLTDITYPTLHPTHFGYDADGRRTLMTDATGTTTWTYGDGLHLSVLTSPVGGVSYWYDADGRRTVMEGYVYNGIGDVSYWYYTYDAGGRLSSLRSTADGTTTFSYDGADRLIRKDKGNADFETYSYDTASQLTDTGYYWMDATPARALHYDYDPSGSVVRRSQGNVVTTYGYDGAGQQSSETSAGDIAYSYGYTYDHNGNRLTQTQNGSVVQSFTYDAHDKLTSGTAGNESDTYDLNGSETRISLGGYVYGFTYDEEDRLVQANYPGGVVDTFVYNGLGLRVAKTDSTGSYSYLCDGASPASPVLWDGHAVYTPGLSERRGGSSSYYENDRLGNLWTLDYGSGKGYSAGYNFSGFGSWVYAGGSTGNPFKFGGGNGCQTDADIGLVLMGHRYYDTRIGRFISQDPAGDGDNWYAYAGNDPMDAVDPDGLSIIFDPSKEGEQWQSGWTSDSQDYRNGVDGTYDFFKSDGPGRFVYSGTDVVGAGYLNYIDSLPMPGGAGTPGGGMIADGLVLPHDPSGLPSGWGRDPSHGSGGKGSERYIGPGGKDALDFDHGRPDHPSKKQQDNHWHRLRKGDRGWERAENDHLKPGQEIELNPASEIRFNPAWTPPRGAAQVGGGVSAGVIAYWIISEVSRLFPPRNLVPVP